ncbi:transcriptional adapter 1 [Striga asiatica]|uniref:Transcriptional adapter 1 n=1 Tax=Striga asiatica TaxID=4170 RepID=A0A5A7QAZ9_STRAF|nr:transcriptional adapter 1 [Striga asiatica]
MVSNHHFTRIDTIELKELIIRKIGPQRAEKYFDQLNRFFAMKLSKPEFDRNCIRVIGRENLPLHNNLIRSILQNACQSKVPPPQKPRKKPENLGVKIVNGYQRNCLQSLQSPRKCRSPVSRDRKLRDRPSPLGPLGKSPSLTCEETFTRTQEQQQQSTNELQSIGSRPMVIEEGEEVEQLNESLDFRSWGPVTAPIGVSVNSGGGPHRKDISCGGCTFDDDLRENCENIGFLPDTKSLRSRLLKKLALEGFGVSLECADLLNNGLDAFLKRMIKPCAEIACSQGQYSHSKNFNNQMVGRPSQQKTVSMLDFRVAMESNPRVLGEDWPLQLERIWHYSSC